MVFVVNDVLHGISLGTYRIFSDKQTSFVCPSVLHSLAIISSIKVCDMLIVW